MRKQCVCVCTVSMCIYDYRDTIIEIPLSMIIYVHIMPADSTVQETKIAPRNGWTLKRK